jgi:hypothetical protein
MPDPEGPGAARTYQRKEVPMSSNQLASSKYTGFAALAAILMLISGFFRAISGLIGIFGSSDWVTRGYTGYYVTSAKTLAWWWLIVGVVLILGGLALFQGKNWGRILALIFIGLAAISEFFLLPVYPLWSMLMLVLYALVFVALLAPPKHRRKR